MLIIEGPDLIGKTTLVKKLTEMSALREKYPSYAQHYSCPNSSFNFFTDYKDSIGEYAIMDRFHVSGIAYQQAITYNRLRLIEAWIGCMGSYTVLLVAEMKWYTKWLKQSNKKQMFSTEKNLEAAQNYYMMAKGNWQFPVHFDQIIWVDRGWPEGTVLSTILDCWYDLLEPIER